MSAAALPHYKGYKGIFILIRKFCCPTFWRALVQAACHLSHHSDPLRTRPAGCKAALALHFPRAPTLQTEWEHQPSQTNLRRSWLTQRDQSKALCLPWRLCHPATPRDRLSPRSVSICQPRPRHSFLQASAGRAAQFIVTEQLSKWHRFHMSALACLIPELSHSK